MAARAESEAVLKMPMPITNPITIIVISNKLNKVFLDEAMRES